MALPTKRHTKSRTRIRRSHHAMAKPTISTCPNCSSPVRPHHACPNCGFYRGREVVKTETVLDKKAKKAQKKERERKAAEQADAEAAGKTK